MKNTTRFSLSLLVVASLAACSTMKEPPPELTSAAQTVRRVETDATVAAQAPLELKKASDSLKRANDLAARGESNAAIVSAAYVAERQALAAESIAKSKTNEEAVKTAELERERARADAREREAAKVRGVAQAAQQRAAAAEGQAAVATAEAIAAKQDNAQLQLQAGQLEQQAADLKKQLETLNAQKTDRGMLVTLGDVLFEFGKSDLKPGAIGSIRKLADFLQQHPERYVTIEGFTDSIGSVASNELLSRRRAQAVVDALTTMGVTTERITFAGYGKDFPVADNNTDANRALNRRVEVYISDSDKPVRPRRG